ncbi:MAG: leucine-rich repeat protein, partial [Candidatus Methanomethylophilaceae archaeon]|nr:leucine-rich repeat protein [Candidatus Methanomethylophilaceae archaeon]
MKPRSIFAVVAVMALVMVAVPVFGVDSSDATGAGGSTEPTEYSGTCGTNLNWTYKDNVLTISGTGTSLNGMGSWVVSGSNSKISSILNDDFTLKVTATKLTTLGTVFKGSDVGSIEFSYAMTIPSSGFEGCKNLTKIDLSKVTSIGASAFKGCTNLKTVNMPSDAIKLESSTFEECESLITISLTKVTSIGEHCFMKCTSLKISDIPNNIIHLGAGCFKGCTSFDKVTFGSPSSSATSYVKIIPESAFDGCSKLKEIVLNDKIENIEENAFRGTKLDTVNLNNVKEINQDAFADVISLRGFVVSPNNAAFYVDQGKYLYTKDKTTLYMVANSETGT